MISVNEQKIIDTHIHLWDLNKYSYDWIANSSNEKLNKNYLLENFLEDSKLLNLDKVVHVEANINIQNNINESRWLQSIADNNIKGIPNAIIGFIDLTNDRAEEEINQHIQFSNFRGIRQILRYDEKEKNNGLNLLENKKLINNLKLLEKNKLSFDLLIYYHQFKQAVEVIAKYPYLQFIINHSLWPKNITSENFILWQDAIDALSPFENVSIKLSGFSERNTSDWNNKEIKPFIDYSIKKFSVERCMFGTNFPVDKAFSPKRYSEYWEVYYTITSHLTAEENDNLFFKNAEKFYKI